MLDILPTLDTADLVFTSPPYEDARTYGIDYNIHDQTWVDWCVPRFLACLNRCRGLVCWVVNGRQRRYKWSATPALLMADLHRAGVYLRRPKIYSRRGIPGSGGPDDWANCYEWIICGTKIRGRLPWSDNLAIGRPWKYPPGGALSHRTVDGTRVNVFTRRCPSGYKDGDTAFPMKGLVPKGRANPGDICWDDKLHPEIIHCLVGGGQIGSRLAHKNEAPFPEALVEPFIRCFCPPGGTVLDPFCGSGTTLAVANRLGRSAVGIDIRLSQLDIVQQRLKEEGDTRVPGVDP